MEIKTERTFLERLRERKDKEARQKRLQDAMDFLEKFINAPLTMLKCQYL